MHLTCYLVAGTLSPESISSDFDFSFLQDWLADFRASSPDYLESVGQHSFSCAITFGIMESQHCDYYLHYSQNRPVSPFSTLSDIEYFGFCLEELFDENRPDSPDSSILPVGAEKSSITISGSPPLSTTRALTYADVVRGLTHESIAEALLVCKPFEFVPIGPQLESSDNKWTHSSIEDWVTKVESQSPKAVASHSGQRPLSSDSPVPQFRFPHICYDSELSRNRSFTPQSTFSDWEGTDLCLETIFDTARPDSPQSVFSDYELDVLFSSRALSPDPMSSDFDFSHLQDWLADFKVSSTESVASQSEHRPVSPDSPVPQYSCQYLGEHVELSRQRSFTPQSLFSDWESTDLCLENLFDPTRPDSPQSVISDYALDVLFSSRALSPESISSDFDFSFLQDWLADFRASSPDYLESVGQHSFSCAITFGIMESQHCDYYLHYSQNRPVSPFSTLSDIEYFGFCLEELFDENRPDSPDSSILPVGAEKSSITISGSPPLSTTRALTYADVVRGLTHESIAEALLVCKPFEFVPIGPQLESSDNKWTHSSIEDWVTKVESQSPKAVASHSGQRPLSSDSPVPQFRFPHICYDSELSRNRSFTPQSTFSDWEGTDLCLETIFDTARPDSPQSVFSDYELDVLFSSRALSPDPMSSDFDFSHLQDWLADFKASSPESVASQSEHRPVSPDSPVPQYSCQYLGEHVELSRNRSFTPQSTFSDWEGTDLCLETIFDTARPDSPQSVFSDYELDVLFSSRALSPDSMSSDFDFAHLQDWLADFKVSSTESVASQSEHRPVSPDSPVPQYSCQYLGEHVELSRQRSFTPQSLFSDWESTDLCLENLFDPTRPDSPQSVISDYALDVLFSSRALSPESISSDFDFSFLQDWLADFRASSPDYLESVGQHSFSCAITFGIMESQHCDYYLHYSQNRPVSPFSTLSDIEYFGFCLEELFDENRPDSPDSSILPVGAEKSSITISGSPPLSTTRALTYADVVRGLTHESIAEALLVCKPFEFVPIGPQLESSDNKWTHSSIEDWVTKVESQSPKAVASHSGQRPLSSDSPVPQFRFPHICYDSELSRNRSFTPQSTFSDWEGTDLCLETIFDTARPDSPQSVFSDYELDVLFSSRALSPDSMSSDFDFSHLQDWLADFKVSSTESVASQSEHRPVSPDSPVPQYSCQYLGEHVELSRQRSFTPQSLFSDWESTDLCLENLFDPTRPDSPQSVISDYALDVLFSSRALSPESISSDFDFSFLQDWLADFRASSPDYLESVGQHSFSCAITFGIMESQHCDYYLHYSQNRPVSPFSTLSDIEYFGFCLEELFDENRPDSPDSSILPVGAEKSSITISGSPPLSTTRALTYADVVRGRAHESIAEALLVCKPFEFVPIGPQLESSDNKWTHSSIEDWVTKVESQSPKAVASHSGQRPLSSDSPVPQFRFPHICYDSELSRNRSFTPQSTFSDWEGTDLCLETIFDTARPDSPQSVFSDYELDVLFSSRALSPDPMSSDFDFSHLQDWLADFKASSPESVASQSEHRPVSPDSPVPQYSCQYLGEHVELSRNRSFTPQSTFSDWEGTDLCLETIFDTARPDSPQSVFSDYELDVLFSSRALSPDSMSSDFDFAHLQDWLADFKVSSTESVASQSEHRPVSPDSPVPQYSCQYLGEHVELSRQRSFTPQSLFSDWESTDLCLENLFDPTRPDSPQSVISDYALDVLFSSRALSPESISSDFDFSFLQDWLADFRASSPDYLESVGQHSFSCAITFGIMESQHCDYYLHYSQNRPVSPFSTLSDIEYFGFCLEELFDENRPDSPDSSILPVGAEKSSITISGSPPLSTTRALTYADVVRGLTHESIAEALLVCKPFEFVPIGPQLESSDNKWTHSSIEDWVTKVESQSPKAVASHSGQRPLSSDSPVPQFRFPHICYDSELSRNRSFTPQSTFSDWEGTDLCLETIFDTARPDSPQSVFSDYELDVLFSSRALSPDPMSSDFDFSHLQDWLADFKASSPESVASQSEHRPVSPDSPVPQYSCQYLGEHVELSRQRSFTPQSLFSDWESTDLCLETIFNTTRPDSPQSVFSDYALDVLFSSRALSPDSMSSDFDFSTPAGLVSKLQSILPTLSGVS
ncbi:uncharacterized protein LOC117543399 isoform X1 [Gymnodraco acuticeps]|uniref:Uncharacterized protein LOC117543399 isoform X1 n=1 Tax=Gymnodraco acuticeps TaxID=8218 RepID=A0A6P8TTK6_GYMAC|nr:uncharacterized protein LOC117543399 isoform X1 [Gymnodraco acuticeps]